MEIWTLLSALLYSIGHWLHLSWRYNRSVRATFIGIGKCVSNKLIVIFSKMTLLATTSSSMEKKISQQGFRMPKFRIPVDAVIFSLGMWWISAVALPRFLVFSSSRKKFCNPLQIVSQSGVFSTVRVWRGYINFPSHEQKGGCCQEWAALVYCYVAAKRPTIQDEVISNCLLKNFFLNFCESRKKRQIFYQLWWRSSSSPSEDKGGDFYDYDFQTRHSN